MTNCPNCGAPYAPGKLACEYYGTVNQAEYERRQLQTAQLERDTAQLERELVQIRFDAAQQRQFAALQETILSYERRRFMEYVGGVSNVRFL